MEQISGRGWGAENLGARVEKSGAAGRLYGARQLHGSSTNYGWGAVGGACARGGGEVVVGGAAGQPRAQAEGASGAWKAVCF